MSYNPADVAAADQHWAMVDADLDHFIDSWRRGLTDKQRVQELDWLVATLSCPHLDDGTETPPRDHVSTLATLLALAIDRLARR